MEDKLFIIIHMNYDLDPSFAFLEADNLIFYKQPL